jgi:excisionase family DNA binding protein
VTAETAGPGEEGSGLLRVPQVAKMLDVSEVTVWRLVGSKELESIKVGRSRRIDPEAVDAYKKRRTTTRPAAREPAA